MQRDPLGYVDGMNLMEYVGANVVNWVDPLGLTKESYCCVKELKINIASGNLNKVKYKNLYGNKFNVEIKLEHSNFKKGNPIDKKCKLKWYEWSKDMPTMLTHNIPSPAVNEQWNEMYKIIRDAEPKGLAEHMFNQGNNYRSMPRRKGNLSKPRAWEDMQKGKNKTETAFIWDVPMQTKGKNRVLYFRIVVENGDEKCCGEKSKTVYAKQTLESTKDGIIKLRKIEEVKNASDFPK